MADAAPLRFTREPVGSRVAGWSGHRGPLAVAVPIVLAVVLSHDRAVPGAGRSPAPASPKCADCSTWADGGSPWATARPPPNSLRPPPNRPRAGTGLRDLESDARAMGGLATALDEFGRRADRLRFHLLGFGGDAAGVGELEDALAPFGAPDDPAWWQSGELGRLDEQSRLRLVEEVNDLCFLWVVAVAAGPSGNPEMVRRAIGLCDRIARSRRAARAVGGDFAIGGDCGPAPRAPAGVRRDVASRELGSGLLPVGPARETLARSTPHARLARTGPLPPAGRLLASIRPGVPPRGGRRRRGRLRHYEAAVALRPPPPGPGSTARTSMLSGEALRGWPCATWIGP